MPSRVGFSTTTSSFGHRRGCCHKQACQLCIQGTKWLPVVLIVAIVSWSYYAYVVHLCIFTVIPESGVAAGVILAAVYHVFLVPFLMSYWQTVWTKPGKVPSAFGLTTSEVDIIETANEPRHALENLIADKDLAVVTRSIQGEIRYCSECSHIKPDRCHHCSVCDECVLKMDHHCPWVNNCVGYYNQKFFFLFLGYAFIYCVYVMLSTLKYFIAYWSHEALSFSSGKFHVIFLFFVSGMFAISLFSLFSYHIYLISQNRTTLEAFRPPVFRHGGSDRKGFYLGKLNNFREVMGDQALLWFVPIFTSLGDGLTFPRQCQLDDEEAGFSDGYDSTEESHQRSLHHHVNRRFQTSSGLVNETAALDLTEDDDEEELLLPGPRRNNQLVKPWEEEQETVDAETSPDSLVDVKFSELNSSSSNTMNGSKGRTLLSMQRQS